MMLILFDCLYVTCRLFILECSSEDVRGAFSRILEKTLVAFIQHGNMPVGVKICLNDLHF